MLTPVHQHWRLVEIWRSGYGQSSVCVCVCVYRQSRGQSIRSVVFREGNRVIDNSHYSRILPGWDQVTKALRTQSGKWSEVFFFFFLVSNPAMTEKYCSCSVLTISGRTQPSYSRLTTATVTKLISCSSRISGSQEDGSTEERAEMK